MTTTQPGRTVVLISVFAIAAIVLLYLVAPLGLPRTCEIRIDCGDLRYSVFGIEVERQLMSEPARSVLLSLSERSDILSPEWLWIPTQVGSNRPNRMCYRFYASAAAWSRVDPEIAVAVTEDVARYIKQTHATNGLPDSIILIGVTHPGGEHRVVEPSWTEDEEILWYLEKKGIDTQQHLKAAQLEHGR